MAEVRGIGARLLMRRQRRNMFAEQRSRRADYLRDRPAPEQIYLFKQHLAYLLLEKRRNQARCRKLRSGSSAMSPYGLGRLCALSSTRHFGAKTLYTWRGVIAAMCRYP